MAAVAVVALAGLAHLGLVVTVAGVVVAHGVLRIGCRLRHFGVILAMSLTMATVTVA